MVRAGCQGRRRPNFHLLIVLSRGGCQKVSRRGPRRRARCGRRFRLPFLDRHAGCCWRCNASWRKRRKRLPSSSWSSLSDSSLESYPVMPRDEDYFDDPRHARAETIGGAGTHRGDAAMARIYGPPDGRMGLADLSGHRSTRGGDRANLVVCESTQACAVDSHAHSSRPCTDGGRPPPGRTIDRSSPTVVNLWSSGS